MSKQDRYFAKVAEYRERFRRVPTEVLERRLISDSLFKEAAVALREVIEERGRDAGTRTDCPEKAG